MAAFRAGWEAVARRRGSPCAPPWMAFPPKEADVTVSASGVQAAIWGPLWPIHAGVPLPEPLSVPLATKNHDLGDRDLWRTEFEDIEDTFSLHRFGWVPVCLGRHGTIPLGMVLWQRVVQWIREVTPSQFPSAWETYSACERIVHWSQLYAWLRRAAGRGLPEEEAFVESLLLHGEYVLSHLEFYGEDDSSKTNNHLINNGRALYVLGAFLNVPRYLDTGRRLLADGMRRSFTQAGFLREGSSHYHILLVSRYLDVLEVARNIRDEAFVEELGPFLDRSMAAARFFLPEKEGVFPLIGDVSPDFDPEWTLRAVEDAARRLLGAGGGLYGNVASEGKGVTDRLRDGWCRYDDPNYRVYWHVQPGGAIPPYSHAHHDTGSFELSVERHPLLVDTGRVSYVADAAGLYGRSAAAHNGVLVDGREPFVSHWLNGGRFLMSDYGRTEVRTWWENASSRPAFVVEHQGFSRLRGIGKYRRRFLLDKDEIVLEDRYEGRGRHVLETFFHAAPSVGVAVEGNALSFREKGTRRNLELALDAGNLAGLSLMRGEWEGGRPMGWFSPRYGRNVPTTTVRFRHKAVFPFTNRFVLRLG